MAKVEPSGLDSVASGLSTVIANGTAVNFAEVTATGAAVGAICRSIGTDGYVYATAGAGSNRMIRTNDGFNSTPDLGQRFSDLGDSRVLLYATRTAEGYFCVLDETGADDSAVYFSTQFASGFTVVQNMLRTQNIAIAKPTVDSRGNTICLIGEYGPGSSAGSPATETRHLYLSENGGQTWRTIYTHVAIDSSGTYNNHIHCACYDTAKDRIWISAGDGPNNFFGYSDDRGSTWHAVPISSPGAFDGAADTYNRPTIMIPFSGVISGTPDGSIGQVGVWDFDRNTGQATINYQLPDGQEPYKQWATSPIARDGTDVAYIVFPPANATGVSDYYTNKAVIVATGDAGQTWHQVWEQKIDPTVDFFTNGIVGPDNSGNLFMSAARSGTMKIYKSAKARWVKRREFTELDIDSRFELTDWMQLSVGESTMPRQTTQSSTVAMTSQLERFAFFRAKYSETVTQVRLPCGTTAAGATPTLVRIGIYSVNIGTGAITLIASTPNDTTLLAAAFTNYTKALSASFTKTSGLWYAVGVLVVTAATAPTIWTTNMPTNDSAVAPRLCATLAGQADLAASVSAGSLVNTGSAPYVVLLP